MTREKTGDLHRLATGVLKLASRTPEFLLAPGSRGAVQALASHLESCEECCARAKQAGLRLGAARELHADTASLVHGTVQALLQLAALLPGMLRDDRIWKAVFRHIDDCPACRILHERVNVTLLEEELNPRGDTPQRRPAGLRSGELRVLPLSAAADRLAGTGKGLELPKETYAPLMSRAPDGHPGAGGAFWPWLAALQAVSGFLAYLRSAASRRRLVRACSTFALLGAGAGYYLTVLLQGHQGAMNVPSALAARAAEVATLPLATQPMFPLSQAREPFRLQVLDETRRGLADILYSRPAPNPGLPYVSLLFGALAGLCVALSLALALLLGEWINRQRRSGIPQPLVDVWALAGGGATAAFYGVLAATGLAFVKKNVIPHMSDLMPLAVLLALFLPIAVLPRGRWHRTASGTLAVVLLSVLGALAATKLESLLNWMAPEASVDLENVLRYGHVWQHGWIVLFRERRALISLGFLLGAIVGLEVGACRGVSRRWKRT